MTPERKSEMDAPLKLVTPTLEGLAPEIGALYDPDPAGGYRLRLDDEAGLLAALKKERTWRTTAEQAAKDAGKTVTEQEAAFRHRLAKVESERDHAKAIADNMRAKAFETTIAGRAKVAGLHDAAVADCVRAARELFDVDAAGEIVSRDGKTTTTVDSFFTAARETSPHWFPATGSGAGIGQSSGRAGGGVTMNRAMFEATSPGQRAALLREGVRLTD
jgi:hypothetical protein